MNSEDILSCPKVTVTYSTGEIFLRYFFQRVLSPFTFALSAFFFLFFLSFSSPEI